MQEIVSGDYITLTLSFFEEDETTPQDISNLGIEFRLKKPDLTTVSKTIGSGVTLLPQSGYTLGQAEVVLQSADTAGIVAPRELWPAELRITLDGNRKTVEQVAFTMLQETT